jgi:endogenous inhibitor of DNA gyrase (YacG/DUF329 family)
MTEEPGSGEPAKAGSFSKCPICGKPVIPETRPFCSRRCQQVDLHRWLSGSYVIPGAREEDEDDAPGGREDN